MFFPIGTDRPQRRFPWMNYAIIAANILVFAVGQVLAAQSHNPLIRSEGIPEAWQRLMLDPMDPRLYQFITYQFLHAGYTHIGFNMLFLYVFGNNLNEKLGHVAYLAFYLAGGVFAGCGQMIVSSGAPTLGASGAISAVTGLFLVLLPRTHIRLFVYLLVYLDVWEIPSMYFVLFKVGQDVFEQVVGGRGVAYMAHISGTLAGVLIGLLLLLARLVQRDHYDLLGLLNRYRRRQEYLAVVASGYDPFDATRGSPVSIGAPPRRNGPMPAVDPRIGSLREEIARLLRLHELSDAALRYTELRAIDPRQVLPPQEQMDVANQLMHERRYPDAAAAYESYLATYPIAGAGQQEQTKLMLALIYARYMPNKPRARELLLQILPGLHNPSERAIAETELKNLDTPPA